jgi:exopolyphosphatase/guanosine-5'-triphosphate,3'-diphosphate pyrophosphatase
MGPSGQDAGGMTELVAVVDLGSTAVRFLLAEIRPDSGYRVLVEERVPTRLGGGPLGTLPREAIDRTLRAVHSFCSRYSPNAWGPRVVAVATSAVRDAKNRERLLGPLRRREGIDVQVLSARDEARFGVYAALDSLPFRDGVVADLGGREPAAQPGARPQGRLRLEPSSRRRADYRPLLSP